MTNLAAKMLNLIISDSPNFARGPAALVAPYLHVQRFVLAAAALLPVYTLKGSVWASTVLFSFANAFFGLAPCGLGQTISTSPRNTSASLGMATP